MQLWGSVSARLYIYYFTKLLRKATVYCTVCNWMLLWVCYCWREYEREKNGKKEEKTKQMEKANERDKQWQMCYRRICGLCTTLGEVIAVCSDITFISSRLSDSSRRTKGEESVVVIFCSPSSLHCFMKTLFHTVCVQDKVINLQYRRGK